jgi:hypothetical protein
MWTEVAHEKYGGAWQMMRMEDGNFIFLSVGLTTAKVFVKPTLDSPASHNELASFPIIGLQEDRRAQSEVILKQLRTAIGWPKSINELRHNLENMRSDYPNPQAVGGQV